MTKRILLIAIFIGFLGIPLLCFSEEVVLKSGGKIEYKSVFSMDEEGITLEVEDGLKTISWSEFSSEEARRVSGGHFDEILKEAKDRLDKKREEEIGEKKTEPSASSTVISQYSVRSVVASESQKPIVRFSARQLELLLEPSGKTWNLSPDEFMAAQEGRDFRFLSQQDKSTIQSDSQALAFLDLRVWEAIVRFRKNVLDEITLSLYNRGDAEELSEMKFQELLQSIEKKLNDWVGKKGVPLKDLARTMRIKLKSEVWIKKPYRLDLEWSFTPKDRSAFLAEFIRLKITKANPSFNPETMLITRTDDRPQIVSSFDLKAHVKRSENGDVFLEGIPMVDQGDKGYCAVATAERILRYYGRPIDQHDIAQMAQTSASEGTPQSEMLEALRRITRRQELQIKVHEDLSAKKFVEMIMEYNRIAKKRKLTRVIIRGQGVDAEDIYRQMSMDIFKEIRIKKTADFEDFKTKIIQYINVGIPLAWGVIVGKVVEKPPTPFLGHHMRLILGYNRKTNEIIYTDSWGPGHEFKRMSLEDAWTITLTLYTVEPRNWHHTDAGGRDFEYWFGEQKSN